MPNYPNPTSQHSFDFGAVAISSKFDSGNCCAVQQLEQYHVFYFSI